MGERNGNAVTFRGWEGGEYGLLDPGVAGRSDKQMFTGSNVMLYRTGLLGPRPGIKEVAFTTPPAGVPVGGGAYFSATDVVFWGLLKTGASAYNVYNYNVTAGTVSAAYAQTDALPTALTHNVAPGGGAGTATFVNLVGHGLYQLDHVGADVHLVSTSPSGDVVGAYGVRMIANNAQTLWYSDANAWSTIGALSYIEISGFSNSFYAPFRDGLIIGTSGGIFNILTGVLGATAVIRELSRGGGPSNPFAALRTADDKIWYWNQTDRFPSMFNGAIHKRYDHLLLDEVSSGAAWVGAIPQRAMAACDWVGTDDWVTYGHGTVDTLMYLNKIMSQHDLGTTYVPGAAFPLGDAHLLLCPASSALATTGTPKAYYFAPGLHDRPAFTSDTTAQPGDGSDGPLYAWFETPEWWDDQGHEVRVVQVIVDYTGWDTGAAGDNVGFQVEVTTLHRAGAIDTTTSSLVTVADGMAASFDVGGTVKRAQVSIDGKYGGGFQVGIYSIENCAIRSITAILSQDPRRV